jgi:glycosyltransferase involved in cell wall biosynthesis
MSVPEVSVVIGAYNCGLYIKETVLSVINQVFKNWELVIVDDGSTDDTYKIISNIRDDRIRVIRLDKNSGLPAISRNTGIKASRGEFIAFLDHDDIWFPDKLSIQLQCLKEDPSIGLVCCNLKIMSSDKRFDNMNHIFDNRRRSGDLYKELMSSNFIVCSSVVTRAAILRDLGYFDEDPNIVACEDLELWLRIARQNKIVFIPQSLGAYRVHDFNRSGDGKQLQRCLCIVDKHLRKNWITEREANKARANLCFIRGWAIIDKNVTQARELFLRALNFDRSNISKICIVSFALILSVFPFLTRFIKVHSLDKKLNSIIRLQGF